MRFDVMFLLVLLAESIVEYEHMMVEIWHGEARGKQVSSVES